MAVYGDSGAMTRDGGGMEKALQNFVLFNKPPFLFYNFKQKNKKALCKNNNNNNNPKALTL